MQIQTQQSVNENMPQDRNSAGERVCHCAFAIYANVPVIDERGRYCSACGRYEFAAHEAELLAH